MAVNVLVRVYDGSVWHILSNVSDVRLRRRAGSGEASFRVNDASLAQLALLRTGRECEVVLTVDGERKVFGGYVDRPRVQVDVPGSFNIHPRIVDLSHGAAWRTTLPLFSNVDSKYTEIIKDNWGVYWSAVDRVGGVTDHSSTHPERYTPGYDSLASFTNEVVERYLPDWVWWVGHDGADANGILKKLFVQPRGYTDRTASVFFGENDIGIPFQVQPTVDPRNDITVVGDDNPSVNSNWPVYFTSEDTNSQAAYGIRSMVTKENEVVDAGALRTVGVSLLEQRKFDLWQGRFQIRNWNVEPGTKVSMYLPTIGVNNGANAVPWVLMEVEERVNRGMAQRWGTFVEHNDAAYYRVT